MLLFRYLCIALLLAASTDAMAGLEAKDARLRLLPGNLPAAGYFSLTNTGTESVVLTGAQSPTYAEVMMHRSAIENGTASMQHIEKVEVAPGATVNFASGGYHLMLMQRRQPVALGDKVEVTLQFADGQSLPVTFTAVSPSAQ
ncbi:copper chaperone PCu(A)C [Metapseudomonas furukawaii]|jgi:copper(I)-binding protein|uniref:Copper metallochaperone n=1 Tax=Metapseudomonas furukawaii TaxID=1149133 RepID=A0AAD1C5P0_METFU|nr:copper chaperone PCu(A)C [Pseudomonas furukawaii]ELS29741.1 Copper metallochaperone, bacterial Cox17-like protein [Pseudomonas furukawaii]WAG78894.1 copper chaperone PCu(A)C [Pseudomonas furukawaii]BAU77220.1 copper metallochaperone [Pseudomonas furukawaii]